MFRYGATTLEANTCPYVTGVYNARAQPLYVDRTVSRQRRVAGHGHRVPAEFTTNVTIGRVRVTGFEFTGRIDDVRTANHARLRPNRNRHGDVVGAASADTDVRLRFRLAS